MTPQERQKIDRFLERKTRNQGLSIRAVNTRRNIDPPNIDFGTPSL